MLTQMPRRLLVVEDEPSVGDARVYAVEREGSEVERVADGKMALSRFAAPALAYATPISNRSSRTSVV